MLRYLLSFFFTTCVFVMVNGMGDSLVENGVWEIISIRECENPELYPFQFAVQKRKLNRTHDSYNSQWLLPETIDETFGVKVTMCRHVDGGCKEFQRAADDSVANYVKKVAEDNVKAVMKLAKLNWFPVYAGEYDIQGYELDKCEFACKFFIGLIESKCEMLNIYKEVVGCLMVTVDFREPENEEEICDKCREE